MNCTVLIVYCIMYFRGDGLGELLKIGKLAETSQVSKRTIDYYTKMGLLICERSESNYRFYPESAVEDLLFIDECKKLNMPLEEIKQRLAVMKASKADPDALINQVEYIKRIMQHLQTELQDVCKNIEALEENEQAKLINGLIPHTAQLEKKLAFFLEHTEETN